MCGLICTWFEWKNNFFSDQKYKISIGKMFFKHFNIKKNSNRLEFEFWNWKFYFDLIFNFNFNFLFFSSWPLFYYFFRWFFSKCLFLFLFFFFSKNSNNQYFKQQEPFKSVQTIQLELTPDSDQFPYIVITKKTEPLKSVDLILIRCLTATCTHTEPLWLTTNQYVFGPSLAFFRGLLLKKIK